MADETKVLSTTKKLLGLMDDDQSFDLDVLLGINTSLTVLKQLGLSSPLSAVTSSTTWTQLLPGDHPELEMVKSYMYFKTRKQFDPPSSSNMNSAMDSMITELEERISYYVDPVGCWEED